MHSLKLYAVAVAFVLAGIPTLVAAECRAFTSSELRQAIIQKTIRVGMKAADVKRSWGEPTRVRRAHPGDDEWEYWNPAGDQIVSIGPDGCVTGWRTARD